MFRRSWSKIGIAILSLLTVLLFSASAAPAYASDVRSGDEIMVEAGETIDDDLILFGDQIIMNGTVTGDLVAMGREIVINGDVGGSVMLGGQAIQVNGPVGGSLYAGGQTIMLNEAANIGRNVYFGGFSMETQTGSQVGRDVNAGAYQVIHNGHIENDLVVASSALQINGSVGGDVRGEVQAAGETGAALPFDSFPGMPTGLTVIDPGLTVGSAATISGGLEVEEVTPSTGDEAASTGPLGLPQWLTNRLGEFIAILIVGALFIWLLPRFLPDVADVLQSRPLPGFGWGLLITLIVFPLGLLVGVILLIMLAVIVNIITLGQFTGLTITLGFGALFFALMAYIFIAYTVSQIIVAYLAGRFILTRMGASSSGRWVGLGYIALGALLYEIVRAIPVLGFILAAVVTFFGVGALYLYWSDRRPSIPIEKAPEPALASGD